jgi:hypothetical protein
VTARLRELVEALDRRMPRRERAAEQGIADDASVIRRHALARLAELDRSTS